MNYEEMSDFEINKAVAIALRPILSSWVCEEHSGINDAVFFDGRDYRQFNYTNCVNYAWPIILKHGITIEFDDNANFQNAYICHEEGYPEFEHGFESNDCDENPLRAACICFLKMKESENV